MRKLINKNRSLAFLTLLLFSINGFAQQNNNSCKDALNLANKEYEAGRISQCVELLKPCIDKLDGKLVFEAWRLLALSYHNLNDEKNANNAVVNLLRHKPDYKDFPYFDPKDFTNLLAKYEVWPQLELGIKAGVNFNSVRSIKNYSVTGSDAFFLAGTGNQSGVLAEYYLKKNVSLNAEILYEGLNYKRLADNVSGWSQDFTENLNYFSIPITGRYYFYSKKKWRIASDLGLQTQILSRTNSNIVLSNSETEEKVENTIEQGNQRNKLLVYGMAGLAAKYKLGGGNLCASIRYAYGFRNVIKADKRYDNLDFILANQYVDSDFSFSPLYVSLGYQFPIPKFYAVKLRK